VLRRTASAPGLRAERPKLGRMSTERLAVIPECAECEARWLPADEERWQAWRCDLEDEPPQVVFFCPACAEREGLGRQAGAE
jgi:hypothetical protein